METDATNCIQVSFFWGNEIQGFIVTCKWRGCRLIELRQMEKARGMKGNDEGRNKQFIPWHLVNQSSKSSRDTVDKTWMSCAESLGHSHTRYNLISFNTYSWHFFLVHLLFIRYFLLLMHDVHSSFEGSATERFSRSKLNTTFIHFRGTSLWKRIRSKIKKFPAPNYFDSIMNPSELLGFYLTITGIPFITGICPGNYVQAGKTES